MAGVITTKQRHIRQPARRRLTSWLAAWPLSASGKPPGLPRLTEGVGQRALVFSEGHLAGIITPSDASRMVDRLSPPGPGNPAAGNRWRPRLDDMSNHN